MSKTIKSYLVCGTPRSGSSLLCGLLANTKIAGNPEEYYWKDNEPFGYQNWGVKTYEEYLEKTIQLGTTPNGVFGAKVMWGYMDDFLAKLRQIPGKMDYNDKELLESVFPCLKFIFIQREDIVAEAVSWVIAIQTGIWFSGDTKKPLQEPVYDFKMIGSLVQEVKAHNRQWKSWFTKYSIETYNVEFENLVDNPNRIVFGALDFLGIDYPKDLLIQERNKKQGNDINKKWIERYLQENGVASE